MNVGSNRWYEIILIGATAYASMYLSEMVYFCFFIVAVLNCKLMEVRTQNIRTIIMQCNMWIYVLGMETGVTTGRKITSDLADAAALPAVRCDVD